MDYLFLMCELAVAFAGFTAVVAVFQRDGDRNELILNKARLHQMLELSLLTLVGGVIPFLFISFGVSERNASRGAAALMLPMFALLLIMQVRRGTDRRLRELPGYNMLYVRFLMGLALPCLAAWVLAAAGVGPAESWYRVGITILIFVAALQFFRTATSGLRIFD